MKFHLRQLALAAALTGASSLAMAADDDWQARVGEALGKTGTAAPGGISWAAAALNSSVTPNSAR